MRRLFVIVQACCFLWLACGFAQAQDFQPWGGAAVQDWSRAAEAVVVSDMAQVTPASALSLMKLKLGCWKVIPYEMVNGPSGNMVFAPPEANAPEITLPLNVKEPGWYAIFVGLFTTSGVPTMAWLRLDDDPAAVNRENRRPDPDYGGSEEVFFKAAKLDEKSSLHIRQQSAADVCGCAVTHVKLIPLSPKEVQRIEADRRDTSHRTVVVTIDGFTVFHSRGPRTAAELLSEIEILRNTDVETVILHTPGADKTNYPSPIGYMQGADAEAFPTIGDRHFAESIKALAEKKINPVKVLIDGAHAAGLKIHVALRPAGWSYFEPYTDYWEPSFYKEHPEWRCVDRDGTPVTRMSWAVPEVRRHLIDLLREQVRFGADGANIVFNRGYPVVLYEPTASKLFQEKYGTDPRDVPESDPRITQWWSDVVTTFFHELRTMLDEEGKARADGKHLDLSLTVLGTAQDDLRFGVDIRRLVDEGLVDEITAMVGFGYTSITYNLPLLNSVCKPKQIPFYGGLTYSGEYPTIPSLYEGGVTGLAIWDAGVADIFEWAWVSRFGHPEETRWRLKNLQLNNPPRTRYRFHKLGDQIRDSRYGPFWGG